ncbi:LysR family transcriptional regulator [Roseomonas sp. 18066]|uniref:LysR family transcriptional regulator n=1 Tax=Roseomonas sp. 18066 TaxID=2681412 RepID=UPI00135B74A6|nr:LysR family transcriptional regulator [Roseomonas sp. 18066]
MNVSHLRSLVAVAEGGSFTAAAAALGLTQSGVSQAIAGLEETLGVTLLLRHARGTRLTAAGERIAGLAAEALAQMARMRAVADEARGLSGGRLRLASFPSVFAALLPGLIRRFGQHHPGIAVTPLEAEDEEIEAWLADGTIDLGVVLNPAPGRAVAMLGGDLWVPVVPAGHRLARRPVVSLAELAAEPFILATGGCRLTAATLAEEAGTPLRQVVVEVRDWASAFAMLREGMGVSLVPGLTLPDSLRGLRAGTLAQPVRRDFGLVASPARPMTAAAQAFVGSLG